MKLTSESVDNSSEDLTVNPSHTCHASQCEKITQFLTFYFAM